MPHISIIYTQGLTEFVASILPELSLALKESAPGLTGIKAYSTLITNSCVEGEVGGQILHLNLRVIEKPERTTKIVELWLKNLANIITEKQPDNCTFTAEANFLPELYISKTK